MPRPRKCRKVCSMPIHKRFGPLDCSSHGDVVIMTVDEYETIRLIDLNRLTQEACAEQMHISRTTVQGIYDEARRKVATAVVEGWELRIEGGDYRLCEGKGCGKRTCPLKKEKIMKIAIPVEEKSLTSNVCPSFGRTPYFLVYTVESKEELYLDNTAIATQGGAGIMAAQSIIDAEATVLIAPRCGENALEVLNEEGVRFYKTKIEKVTDAMAAFLVEEA